MVPIMATFLLISFPIYYKGIISLIPLCILQIFFTFLIALFNAFLIEFPSIKLERLFLMTETSERHRNVRMIKNMENKLKLTI